MGLVVSPLPSLTSCSSLETLLCNGLMKRRTGVRNSFKIGHASGTVVAEDLKCVSRRLI